MEKVGRRGSPPWDLRPFRALQGGLGPRCATHSVGWGDPFGHLPSKLTGFSASSPPQKRPTTRHVALPVVLRGAAASLLAWREGPCLALTPMPHSLSTSEEAPGRPCLTAPPGASYAVCEPGSQDVPGGEPVPDPASGEEDPGVLSGAESPQRRHRPAPGGRPQGGQRTAGASIPQAPPGQVSRGPDASAGLTLGPTQQE